MKKSSGISTVAILIAVVVLIGLGGGGYYLYSQNPDVVKSSGLIRNPLSNQETHEFDGQTLITGDNVKLPKDFPSHVPIYPKADITTANYTDLGAHLQQSTSDDKDTSVKWYKDLAEKNGWVIGLDYDDTTVGYYTLTYSTDEYVFDISVRPGEGKDGDTLIIFNSGSKGGASKGQFGQDETVGDTYDDAMQKLRDLESKVGDDR